MSEIRAFLKGRQPVTLLLIGINVIVFLVLSFMGDVQDGYFMFLHGANFTPSVIYDGEYYRWFSCMFLHFGVEHLFYNMLVLLFLGDTLEKAAGKVRYLIIYLGGGVLGNAASAAWDMFTEDFSVSAGASGCIFAVIGALVGVVILNKGKLEDYSGRRLLMMAGLSVLQGLTATGIDNCAHIGGMISGFLLALLFHRKLTKKEWSDPIM